MGRKWVCEYCGFRDARLGGVVTSSDEEGVASRRRKLLEPLGPNERRGFLSFRIAADVGRDSMLAALEMQHA